jgi:hypothetical protein
MTDAVREGHNRNQPYPNRGTPSFMTRGPRPFITATVVKLCTDLFAATTWRCPWWDQRRTLAVRNIVEPSWVSGTYTTHPRDVRLTAVTEARVGRPAQSLTMCTSTSLTHTRGLRLSVDRLRQTQLLLRQQHRAGVGGERQRQRLG